jgi:hypothetical protein
MLTTIISEHDLSSVWVTWDDLGNAVMGERSMRWRRPEDVREEACEAVDKLVQAFRQAGRERNWKRQKELLSWGKPQTPCYRK